jgi:hypothetical protein
MKLAPEIAKRLVKFLLVAIDNDQDGERINALRMVKQTLVNANISVHDLVQNLTSPGYSDDEALVIYCQGGDDREQQLRAHMPVPRGAPRCR